MKLAIVGSCSLAGNPGAEWIIQEVIKKYNPDTIVSGGAIGIDSMAAEAGRKNGLEVIEFLPKEKNWHNGFKPRNIQIAETCDKLVRIVSKDSKTYGSGWTRDYAKKLGKETFEFKI